MGARISSRLPRTEIAAERITGQTDCRIYRQRHATRAPRHHRAAAAKKSGQIYRQLSSPKPELLSPRMQRANPGRPAGRYSEEAQGQPGDCLFADNKTGRNHGRAAKSIRNLGDRLPRQDGCRGTREEPGAVDG